MNIQTFARALRHRLVTLARALHHSESSDLRKSRLRYSESSDLARALRHSEFSDLPSFVTVNLQTFASAGFVTVNANSR